MIKSLGNLINVQAYKYDGTLYRQWNGVKLLSNDSNYVCCLLSKTKVTEQKGQKWVIKEPTIWFFSKKYFFNVTITPKEDGLYYYVNLASPFFFEENTIKFIDFDYDIKIYPKKYYLVVDHVDFVKNRAQWYNQDIVDVIHKNIAIITEKVQAKEDIFDEYYVWNIYTTLIKLKEITNTHLKFLDKRKK